MGQRVQEGVLEHILGILSVAEHAQAETVDRGGVRIDHPGELGAVSGDEGWQ
jgi:hypothetical protein